VQRRFILIITLLVTFIIGLSSLTLLAQDVVRRNVSVPFDFVFGDTRLPAGSYEIQLLDSGMVMLLNSKQPEIEADAATLPLLERVSTATPELVFAHIDQDYVLVEIHSGQERRLMTSQYGHKKFSQEQLRRVAITLTAEQQQIVQPASAKGQ
jgi:hypothetical protein